jgi:hypothetical protein
MVFVGLYIHQRKIIIIYNKFSKCYSVIYRFILDETIKRELVKGKIPTLNNTVSANKKKQNSS